MVSIISKLKYIPYAWANYGEEEIAEVNKCLRHCPLIPSFHTRLVEEELASLFGHKYGLATNSGTSALILAAEVIKKFVSPKKHFVVTPACTFVATVTPFLQRGFQPLFYDVDWSYTIDMTKVNLERMDVAAFVVPNLSGSVADWPATLREASKIGAIIVEDSCDVICHTYKGNKTAKYVDISVTSFYAPHHITACGGGGMFMTSKKEWYEYALSLREWGRVKQDAKSLQERLNYKLKDGKEEIPFDQKYVFENNGYNFKPIEVSMAFASAQLMKLKEFNKKREDNVRKYQDYFRDKQSLFSPFQPIAGTSLSLYGFPITVKKRAPFSRKELCIYLEEHKIETRPVFVGDIRKQPLFQKAKFEDKFLPVTAQILRGGLLLPCHTLLEKEDLDYIFKTIDTFLANYPLLLS